MFICSLNHGQALQKKNNRGVYGDGNLQDALRLVRDGMPLIRVSKELRVPARTIRRQRDALVATPGKVRLGSSSALPPEVELVIHDHIQTMERALYGLTPTDVRRLAYDVAVTTGTNYPFNQTNKLAGKDWLKSFLRRHPDLSIRQPQGTNLSRAVGFNRAKVNEFFGIYKDVLNGHEYLPSKVWNMDETGITSVHQPGKVVASKGVRQVAKMTSGEGGATVTVICAVSAAGAYLPPFIIFPRKRMVDQLMQGAPPQSVGHASASGWTDAGLFLKWMEHFVLYTNASTQNRHLIVLDGHHNHKTLDAVNYARSHGIELITLPPHCTHKMQPLDRCYFKSLKSAYNVSADNWMTSHHGQRITFYDMAGIFGTAFLRTSTPDKAINGFRACGLWPFDDTIFQDNEFAAAAVTEEGPPIYDTTEQADVAAVEGMCTMLTCTIYTGHTSVNVHTMDIPKPFHHTLEAKRA